MRARPVKHCLKIYPAVLQGKIPLVVGEGGGGKGGGDYVMNCRCSLMQQHLIDTPGPSRLMQKCTKVCTPLYTYTGILTQDGIGHGGVYCVLTVLCTVHFPQTMMCTIQYSTCCTGYCFFLICTYWTNLIVNTILFYSISHATSINISFPPNTTLRPHVLLFIVALKCAKLYYNIAVFKFYLLVQGISMK